MSTHTWEPYLPGNSLLHRLDPRLKLLGTLATALTATLVPSTDWASLLALAGLLAIAVALSRLPLRSLLARAGLALPFMLLAALSVPFARQGTPLWQADLGPLMLTLTREGLVAMGAIVARAWLSLWAATLLVATTPVPALQHALWLLHVPPILCSTIALMIRYLYVLVDEAARLMAARASRSPGQVGSIAWRARVLGGMIGSLFVRTVERAERIHAAMLARGFDGTPRALHRLNWRPADTRTALVWTVGLLCALAPAIL